MAWNIFVLFVILVMIFLIGLNVKSLIMKWKANPQSSTRFHLGVGFLISFLAIGGLIYLFIVYLSKFN